MSFLKWHKEQVEKNLNMLKENLLDIIDKNE